MQFSKYLKDKASLEAYKTKKINPKIVELVAMGPYLTNVAHPERWAKQLLVLLKADVEGFADLSLQPDESIESYGAMGTNIPGAENNPLFAKRNALLTIIALNDQWNDLVKDKKKGKSNIFSSYATETDALAAKTALLNHAVATADAIASPQLDAVLTTSQAKAMSGWSG